MSAVPMLLENQVQPMEQREAPALAPSLQVLDDHISAHPEQLQPMTTDLVVRLDDLVGAADLVIYFGNPHKESPHAGTDRGET